MTTVIKVKADIVDRLTASPKGRAVITNVETFKTDLQVFTDDVITCLTSHWLMIFSILIVPLIAVFTYKLWFKYQSVRLIKNTHKIASGTTVGQHIWFDHTLSVDDIHIMSFIKSSSQSVRWPLRCIQVSKDHESFPIY